MDSINWTERIDEALEHWQGQTAREAGERAGISPQIITQWRRRRRAGEQIQEVRGRNRAALLRFLELGYETGRIPVGVRARTRRLPRGS